jgi:hypothetical protein
MSDPKNNASEYRSKIGPIPENALTDEVGFDPAAAEKAVSPEMRAWLDEQARGKSRN